MSDEQEGRLACSV